MSSSMSSWSPNGRRPFLVRPTVQRCTAVVSRRGLGVVAFLLALVNATLAAEGPGPRHAEPRCPILQSSVLGSKIRHLREVGQEPAKPRNAAGASKIIGPQSLGRVKQMQVQLDKAVPETPPTFWRIPRHHRGEEGEEGEGEAESRRVGEGTAESAQWGVEERPWRRGGGVRDMVLQAQSEPLTESVTITSLRNVSLNLLDHHHLAGTRVRISCSPGVDGETAFFALAKCPHVRGCRATVVSWLGTEEPDASVKIAVGAPAVPEGAISVCSSGIADEDSIWWMQPPLNCPMHYQVSGKGGSSWSRLAMFLLRHPEKGCAQYVDFLPQYPVAFATFAMHNVYVSGKGMVFNSSSLFRRSGCGDGPDMSSGGRYSAGSRVVKRIGAAVNVGYPLCPNFYHCLIESFPALVMVAPIMRRDRELAWLASKEQFLAYERYLAPLLGVPLRNIRRYEGGESNLFRADLVYQPVYQTCGQPSASLWHELRRRYLLHPDGVPLFNWDWSSRMMQPLSEAETQRLPEEWLVVLGKRATGSRAMEAVTEIEKRLAMLVPPHRLVLFYGNLTIVEARSLFLRTKLFIAGHGAAMSNMVFMPVGGSVIEVRPNHYPNACYHALADACSLKYHLLFGEGNKTSTIGIGVESVFALAKAILDAK